METVAESDALAGVNSLVDRWVAHLAAGNYDAAFGMTSHHTDGARSGGDIQYEIEGYCSGNDIEPFDGSFRVSPTHNSDREQRRNIDFYDPPKGNALGTVWYDLAINETLTDLTATFRIIGSGGKMGLQLDAVHVM